MVERSERRKRKKVWGVIVGGTFALLFVSISASFFLGVFPFEKSRANPTEGAGLVTPGDETRVSSEAPSSHLVPLEDALRVKGIYVTLDSAGTPSKFASIIKFVREHEGLNALVIDVKDNSGRVPCPPPEGVPSKPCAYRHFPGLIQVLKREGYYLIARVVAFQDPYMAALKPDQAIRRSDGSLWRDRDGRLWLNPYDKRNWEFVKNIALWAQEMGFDEIQLDYVRFPDSAMGLEKSGVLMPGSENFSSRSQAIVEFLKYMKEALHGKAYLSADVFGFVTIAKDDMGIGQKIEDIASTVDFISPMVYPSHYYNPGIYGLAVPEADPYRVVSKAIDEAIQRTEGLGARIRPWLQDFSLRIRYGPKEVQDQINAVLEHGVDTFLLWNPANTYTEGVRYVREISKNK
ncbi:MAG TPA: GTP-binding protein [Firmicutes bacterium]|nr:GTP-binding protein [Candidatus Fermentithermobacillaceae bacterium]